MSIRRAQPPKISPTRPPISAILKLGENRRVAPISIIKEYIGDERKDITIVTASGNKSYKNMPEMGSHIRLIGTNLEGFYPNVRFRPLDDKNEMIDVQWGMAPPQRFTIQMYKGLVDKTVVRDINMNLGAALRILMRLLEHVIQSDGRFYKRTFADDCEELFDQIYDCVTNVYDHNNAQNLLKKAMRFFNERCMKEDNIGGEHEKMTFVGWWMIIGTATDEWGR